MYNVHIHIYEELLFRIYFIEFQMKITKFVALFLLYCPTPSFCQPQQVNTN